ncbi:alternative oxidase [Ophiostoma piceae UAMH 11346]|uniref:Alternative oxidase n=1 Tax=Ophiostoma piceae (strain UAMH 11346) TaxID=1262450 RepID=S3BU19_OPHP1|nr:alternative oxidase [Ophiostoma piceae UAMH 11346]
MMDKLRLVHYLRISSVALVFIWLFVHFAGGGDDHNRYTALFRQFRDERAVFVDDFLSHDVSGRFESDGIMSLCSGKRWTSGLVLTCDAVPGNMADVKNGVLTCIRIAIEMGAELILPNIMLRSTMDLGTVTPHDVGPRRGVPLEQFFDRPHLVNTLSDSCPQLKVHPSMDDFYNEPSMLTPFSLDLYKVPGVKVSANLKGSEGKVIDGKLGDLGKQIHGLLDNKAPRRDRKYPFHVDLRPTPSYALPAFADSPKVRNYFGRIMQVRPDLRALAGSVLFNLQKALGVTIDPRKGIDIDAFIAVELRTQHDPRKFPPYEVQASDALAFASASNMSHIYLTEGTLPEHVTTFADRARDFNFTVVTKEELVDGPDAFLLSQLSYDERFLVDYEVALRSGLFMGNGQSSFAWNVGLRREFAYGDKGAHDASHLNGAVRWFNQYSTLYGKDNVGDELRRGIWP